MNLTRKEIESLPAGRELDGLIAEHIFGYRRSAYGAQVVFESPAYQQRTVNTLLAVGDVYSLRDVPGGREAVIAGKIEKSGWPNTLIDFYSTDIAAAWKIVEHLSAKGEYCDIKRLRDHATGLYPHECEIWHERSVHKGVVAIADTAALAICRAALCNEQ